MLLLPATPEVLEGFVAEADAAPEELPAIANVMPAPPLPLVPGEHHGRPVILALLAYAGDVQAGERPVDRLRALTTRLAAVKAAYDPDNVFRLNQNVPPAGGTGRLAA